MRKHLTYANVMVTLLAIGALTGGVAYAANTIGSTDIINGEVKSVDIGTGQVQSADVKNEGLTGADISEVTLGPTDDAYGRFHDAPLVVPGGSGIGGLPRAGDEDVLSLDLPAGSYFVLAKGTANTIGNPQNEAEAAVQCILYADGDTDRATLDSFGPFGLTVVATASAPFTVHLACNMQRSSLTCNQLPGCATLRDLKINAVGVRSVTNSAG